MFSKWHDEHVLNVSIGSWHDEHVLNVSIVSWQQFIGKCKLNSNTYKCKFHFWRTRMSCLSNKYSQLNAVILILSMYRCTDQTNMSLCEHTVNKSGFFIMLSRKCSKWSCINRKWWTKVFCIRLEHQSVADNEQNVIAIRTVLKRGPNPASFCLWNTFHKTNVAQICLSMIKF